MLNHIKIEGYKSIRKMELELNPINLLIGSNGVGKTNFISFFKLVNAIYQQRLQRYTLQNNAENLLYYGLKHTKEITGYLQFGDNSYGFTLQPKQDTGQLFLADESSYYKESRFYKENIIESQIKDSTTYRDKWLREYLESYIIYHFHDTATGSPLRTDAFIKDTKCLRPNGDNLAAFLYMLQSKYPKTLKRIEAVIQSVMPYFERFDLNPLPDNEKIALVWIDANAPDKYFSANDLSDGSIRFIALTTLLMQPQLPKVIIIDEPELGLHPVAITQLAALIKSAAERNCQLIISTQSVNLINLFHAEDVITVDREDRQSVFNRLDAKLLERWINDYSLGDLWVKSVIKGQP